MRGWITWPSLFGAVALVLGAGGWWQDQSLLKERVARLEESEAKREITYASTFVRKDLWDQKLDAIQLNIQQLRDEVRDQKRGSK